VGQAHGSAGRQARPSSRSQGPAALQRVTLGELVVRYRDTVSVTKKGGDREHVALTAFLRHSICNRRLSDLRTEDFGIYRDTMLKTIKPTSLKRYLDPVHNLFELAKNEWGIPLRGNPLDRLKLNAPSQRRERRFAPGEWERLLGAAELTRNPLIEPIVRLALATAMRRGEILAIEASHISIERRSLLIRLTKNGQARTIPLTSNATADLGSILTLLQVPLARIARWLRQTRIAAIGRSVGCRAYTCGEPWSGCNDFRFSAMQKVLLRAASVYPLTKNINLRE
jgi:integrase